ncbi:hypothetical protein E2C01_044539 [Portunus trituberculatus]|uniref:Uncharacterized protein n=1 Tax=Portunus trituberculatus TaxID=210409 RepID=A0A5B7FSF5_PORTR|nr:hypothetical protein [Portunus trituberculatus]
MDSFVPGEGRQTAGQNEERLGEESLPHHHRDSELELGDRVGRLRGLDLGEGDRFLGLPDLLGGEAERLRGTGERLRGLGEGLRSKGERLRGLGDRLRGLGDRLRWDGECLRGLEDRFREEPLRLRSSSFLGCMGGGGIVDKVVSMGSGRCPHVGLNTTKYGLETKPFVKWFKMTYMSP